MEVMEDQDLVFFTIIQKRIIVLDIINKNIYANATRLLNGLYPYGYDTIMIQQGSGGSSLSVNNSTLYSAGGAI